MAEYTQDELGLTVDTPAGPDAFLLRSLNGEDRISGLFTYHLELISQDAEIDMDALVGEPITAIIKADGEEFAINGICARLVQAGTGLRFTTYYAELRPWLWVLTQVNDSRIFQEMSVPDIIEDVFGANGFSDYELKLNGSYDPREYCVQYQESTFNFVSRLMEDEGIFYFFTHEDGLHTMVITDDVTNCEERPGALNPYRVTHQDSAGSGGQIITHFAFQQQVQVGGYAMQDYEFKTPSTDLSVNAQGERSELEVFEYPGGYFQKGGGEGRVKVRIEAQEQATKLVKGKSSIEAFISGTKFTVDEHARAEYNDDYILQWVSTRVNKRRYQNTFEAFPATVPYRPQVVTRKPRVEGLQTAVVCGPDGEEIHTDEYGRIKVHFHWDRHGTLDDKSSIWIRVAQSWAGKGWGAWFLPRIGQEVVVSFLEGDPDRPLVTGSVYNAEMTVPYALPDNKTKSTTKSESSKEGAGKYNEIRFEDKLDEEEIWIHAEKDQNVVINNDHTRFVGNDETKIIHANRTTTIEEGDETLTVMKGMRIIEVTDNDEEHTVGAKRTVNVTDDEEHNNDANFTHNVAGDYTLSIDGNLTIDVGGSIAISAGADWAMEAGTSIANKSGTTFDNEAGTDLTNKAGVNLTNDAGVAMTNKAAASQTVDGGGMLTCKGGIVQIN